MLTDETLRQLIRDRSSERERHGRPNALRSKRGPRVLSRVSDRR